GSSAASAVARAASSASDAMVTMPVTPAARALATTLAASATRRASVRWQCESKNMDLRRSGKLRRALRARGVGGWRGPRRRVATGPARSNGGAGARRPVRAAAALLGLGGPALLDLEQRGRSNEDRGIRADHDA